MAYTRNTNFTDGVLDPDDLNTEFNGITNYMNTRLLSNPLTQDLDFADLFEITNLRRFWNIFNAAEFSTLAAAIAAMPSTGGMLFIPPNTTFDLSATLDVTKDSVLIVGGGPSSIIRRASGTFSETGDCMILFDGQTNCGILNLQLDGQQLSNAAGTGMAAVRVKGASTNFSFIGNYVRRWGGNAETSSATNDGIAIGDDEASVPRGARIHGNLFEDVRRSAVRIVNCDLASIIGNEVVQSSVSSVAAGIHLETPASGNARIRHGVVRGNTLIGVGATLLERGIAVVAGIANASVDLSRLSIGGNTISNCSAQGIYLEKAFLSVVQENEISNVLQSGTTARGGIELRNSSLCKVGGNTVQDAGSAVAGSAAAGIYERSTSGAVQGHNTIIGNTTRLTASSGIAVEVDAAITVPSVKVQDNLVLRHMTQSNIGGISVSCNGTITSATVEDNTVTLDGTVPSSGNASGVSISNAGTFSRATIVGNDLTDGDAGTGSPLNLTGTAVVSLDLGHNQV